MTASNYSKVIASICNKIASIDSMTGEWLEDNGSSMLGDDFTVSYNASQVVVSPIGTYHSTNVVDIGGDLFIEVTNRSGASTTVSYGNRVTGYSILPFGGYKFLVPSDK